MHDPDFDGILEKKDKSPELDPPAATKPRRLDRAALSLLLPIPRAAQAVFAEALRQGLMEKIPADRAVALAALVTPRRRFRQALLRMATNIRSGYPIEVALAKTGAKVHPGLLAALRIGEQNGCLAEELAAFARRAGRFRSGKFLGAIGRSEEAREFAAALARQLHDRRLTVREVRAAGQIADKGNGRFARVVDEVARRMEDGYSLSASLRLHPAHFDELFCGLLESTHSRQDLRACLERLGMTI